MINLLKENTVIVQRNGTHVRLVLKLNEKLSECVYKLFNDRIEIKRVDVDSDSITKLSPHPTILNASILFVAHSKFTLGMYSIDLDESNEDRLVIYYDDKIE